MKFVPVAVSRTFGRQLLHVQKASPNLLFVAGIVGFGATVYFASKASRQLDVVLDKHDEDMTTINSPFVAGSNYDESDRRKDKAQVYIRTVGEMTKLYGPAVLCGVASVAALTKSHHILTSRNAAITAAYSVVTKAFDDYRDRVREDVGEEREREYRFPAEKHEITDDGKKRVVRSVNKDIAPSMYAKFFDEFSSSWKPTPDYNMVFLRCQQQWANDMLLARGHVLLNDVYDALGIPRTKAGCVVGWVLSETGDNYIDFGIFDKDKPGARDFVNAREGAILLDFNVDGIVYDRI